MPPPAVQTAGSDALASSRWPEVMRRCWSGGVLSASSGSSAASQLRARPRRNLVEQAARRLRRRVDGLLAHLKGLLSRSEPPAAESSSLAVAAKKAATASRETDIIKERVGRGDDGESHGVQRLLQQVGESAEHQVDRREERRGLTAQRPRPRPGQGRRKAGAALPPD